MLRITDILDKAQAYLAPAELEMIEKAYVFSASVHQGQLRLSGEPYLTHPMEVAGMLADMKLDAATIITGLLHDTVEDTLTTIEQIEAVEYDQLMAVAKRILSPDQATMAIVGPFSDETEFTRALGV